MARQLGILGDGTRLHPRPVGQDNDVLTVLGKNAATGTRTGVRKTSASGRTADKSAARAARKAGHLSLNRWTSLARPGRLKPLGNTSVPAPPLKLKVVVRLDVNMGSAHIHVRGNVTDHNVGAVYVVARRACGITSGSSVVLDLRQASVEDRPMAELQLASGAGELPASAGSPPMPCQLNVLEPAAAY